MLLDPGFLSEPNLETAYRHPCAWRVFLESQDQPEMLRTALPALDWMQVGDEWSISYGDAMQVWGLLVSVPHLKDAAWPHTTTVRSSDPIRIQRGHSGWPSEAFGSLRTKKLFFERSSRVTTTVSEGKVTQKSNQNIPFEHV